MEISDKVAVVTGGAMGMGKAFCRALLSKGAKVCLIDINDEVGNSTLVELQANFGPDNVQFITCDVSVSSQYEAALKQTIADFGKVDIVVNDAGVVCEHTWEKCIDVNFKGAANGTVLAVKYMRKDKGGEGGTIVNIASDVAFKIEKFYPTYCATKHAILAYTKCWKEYSEYANLGVTVLCLCPGGTETPIFDITDEATLNSKWFDDARHSADLMSPDYMGATLVKFLEDNQEHSGVMLVTKKEGAKYIA